MKTIDKGTQIAATARTPPAADTPRPKRARWKRPFLLAITVLSAVAPLGGEFIRNKQDEILHAFSRKLSSVEWTVNGDPIRNHELQLLEHMDTYVSRQEFVDDHRTNADLLFSAAGGIGALILGTRRLTTGSGADRRLCILVAPSESEPCQGQKESVS